MSSAMPITDPELVAAGSVDDSHPSLDLALFEVLSNSSTLENVEVMHALEKAIVHLDNVQFDFNMVHRFGNGVPAGFYKLLAHPDQDVRSVVRLTAFLHG
jgi:hypothetical protein